MLSSLLRPKKARRLIQEVHSPFSSPYADQSSPAAARRGRALPRHASADFTETEMEDDTEDEAGDHHNGGEEEDEEFEEDEHELEEEDGDEDQPLLPIFSAAHLGIYFLTPSFLLRKQILTG